MGRGEDSTRQAFADAYIKLQGANPESRISVKDISAAAGFDRHTFYYHFTGLQDLVSWIFDREFSRIMEDSDGSWEAVLLKFLEYFLGVSSENLPQNSILREFVGGSCFLV